MSAFAKFYFRPSPGEKIHTVAAAREDNDCGIFGHVTDGERPLQNAFVLLFEADGQAAGRLVSAVTTDADGAFAFGPLEAGRLYLAKVYRDGVKVRELEISV
ncbi:MAG: hypothetical protein ACOX66_01710 [Oscillospiraceae bacterium]